MDKLERNIYGIDFDIQLECFGITWERPFKKKKVRKKNSKELNEIYKQRYNELEDVLNDDFFKQDLYQRIYKLKNVINGPKVEAPEPTAINDPITGELITDNEEIKRVSLEHNVKILTKNKPKRKDMELINLKKCNHKEIMRKGVTNSWALNQSTFNKVVEKIRKKRKKVYILFTKVGDSYKQALF